MESQVKNIMIMFFFKPATPTEKTAKNFTLKSPDFMQFFSK